MTVWDLVSNVAKIIEKVNLGVITRKGVVKLLSMEENLPKNQFRLVNATANLVGKVLCNNLSEFIKEQELSARFLEPLFSGLFDDPDNNTLIYWLDYCRRETKFKLDKKKT